jgi:tRNA-specific 2-thiouridylase
MKEKESKHQITVVVGLSGGVDSSVAAYLLKEQGYRVIGVFMRNWTDSSVVIAEECPWIEDSNDARIVADKLEIPFQVLDLSDAYKTRIVDYMFAEYEAGRTPNPDVLCNREIKFDVFLEAAKKLGANYVATGHYCQRESVEKDGVVFHRLLAGADPNKDQSYFLCQITSEQLSSILFPIGHLQKSEVREIASLQGLVTANKKDSQGLCFVGKVRLPDFLQQRLAIKEGEVVEIPADADIFRSLHPTSYIHTESPSEDFLCQAVARWHFLPEHGKVIGKHVGAHFYTIGQRKGLQIGGRPFPLFVLGINTQTNHIYVGMGEKHPGLFGRGLFIETKECSFIREDLRPEIGEEMRVQTRIRYRQPLISATLYRRQQGYFLIFDHPQSAIAPGQFAAFYLENELIGSGTISGTNP